VIGIKLGSIPQWTKNGERFYASLLQILDNHVIDYIPPEIVVTKGEKNKTYSRNGTYGMQLVGALSTDPRKVGFYLASPKKS
jgi:large subunit ribosomal protein L3